MSENLQLSHALWHERKGRNLNYGRNRSHRWRRDELCSCAEERCASRDASSRSVLGCSASPLGWPFQRMRNRPALSSITPKPDFLSQVVTPESSVRLATRVDASTAHLGHAWLAMMDQRRSENPPAIRRQRTTVPRAIASLVGIRRATITKKHLARAQAVTTDHTLKASRHRTRPPKLHATRATRIHCRSQVHSLTMLTSRPGA